MPKQGVQAELMEDPADAFQTANIKRVLAEQITRVLAFHMALSKLQVGFFEQFDLRLGELKALGQGFLLYAQKPLVFVFKAFFQPGVANTVRTDRHAFKGYLISNALLAEGRMLKTQSDNLI